MKARWLILCAVALVLAACGKPSAKPPLVVLAHAAVGPDALRAGLGPGASLVVQWSTDAGNAWSVATAALPTGTGPVEAVHLALPAKGDGWLLVRGKSLCVLLRSRDGGRTWSSQHQPALQSCQAAAMAFRTPSQGWIVTADGSELLIYSTPDGGQTWSPSSAPLPVSTSFTVEAIDGPVFTGARQGSFRVHYGGSASGVLGYATADGGAAWTVTTPTPTMATARLGDDEWQVDQPLSGGPLPIRRSTDGGRTWATSDIRLPANLSAPVWAHAQFVDAVHGWVLAAGAPATAQEMWVAPHHRRRPHVVGGGAYGRRDVSRPGLRHRGDGVPYPGPGLDRGRQCVAGSRVGGCVSDRRRRAGLAAEPCVRRFPSATPPASEHPHSPARRTAR